MSTWPDGSQSALTTIGPEAAWISDLAWALFAGAACILIGVTCMALYAAFAKRDRTHAWGDRPLIVGGGIVFPAAVLSVLIAYSLMGPPIPGARAEADALHVEIVAEQWWWRINYLAPDRSHDFALANELRLPVGRTVVLHLRSADVIHSFWVPALAGKLDMIPGRTHTLRVRADRPGRVRGQCAEYCGGPHGLMAFPVVAEPPADFERWAAGQRRPGASPATAAASEGHDLFLARCGTCHAMRGTPAAGSLGPDLTHVGSRLTLGAGVLPTNADTLAAWIVAAQRLKPGSLMPAFPELEGAQARAIALYLGGRE